MNVDGIMVLATGSTKEYEEVVEKTADSYFVSWTTFSGSEFDYK